MLDKKILKHLSFHNVLSECQYGFCQGRSTSDLLAFLTFSVALVIAKVFDRVKNKALISKLSLYDSYSSLCNFIITFFSDRAIVCFGHCFSHKFITVWVPQGFVLSPTNSVIH